MAITSTVSPAVETPHLTTIAHLDDAASPAAASYKLGYKPRYISVLNFTDKTRQEWFAGMASNAAVNTTAAGAVSTVTTNGITVAGDTIGFVVVQNKQFYVVAEG